ncbi:MAG: 5-dehydro-2-deoxygluconokinase [Stappiaceae bacterium]
MPEPRQLDVITIGRSSVDLYGQQIGSRLEDIDTFAKSVGGCPSNIAIGTSRLGLNSGVITRVGDEQMGRFIMEQMVRENVSTQGISTDPSRLTALVILSVRDEETFPLIFYRDNCADMALEEADIDPDFIRSAASIVVTGTHFSTPNVELASRKAIKIARDAGLKVIFDIDYRPNLWGLAGHDAGEERYIASKNVSDKLKTILSDCDLVVGTEEELMIAGGQDEPLAAIREIRSLSDATIVCKRGPMGCVVFPDVIPDDLDKGIKGPGFPVDVYNVLGAGDAFMSGFLRGYLRNEPLETCAQWANACGAFAVSRLLCSPESPTWAELQYFLEHGSQHRALRKDQDINHIHHATTRRPQTETLMALAIDHRKQLEEIADRHDVSYPHLEHFKKLAVQAAMRVAQGKPGYGMLLDSDYGRTALYEAEGQPFWIGRPVEQPGSRPLDFDHGGSLAARLTEWPVDHCVKCLCFFHPDDASDLRNQQERELLRLNDACRTVGREMLVEIIAGNHGPLDAETIPRVMRRLYDLGIKPDWWKLEPQTDAAAWQNIDRLIDERDPYCRGVVILGLNAPEQELLDSFKTAQTAKHVKGFAVGRTIFADAADQWLKGDFTDDQAVTDMAERFARLTQAWIGMKS